MGNETTETPRRKRRGRPNGKTLQWIPKFLECLSDIPNVSAACRAAGVDHTTAYEQRRRNPEFAAQWKQALENSTDELVGCLWERAKDKDTVAAIFLLKHHRPEVYQEIQRIQHEGTAGGEPIRITREEVLRDPDYLAYRRAKALSVDGNGRGDS